MAKTTEHPIQGGGSLELTFNKATLIEKGPAAIQIVEEQLVVVSLQDLLIETENNTIICFYAIVIGSGDCVERTSNAGKPYAKRVLSIIDDTYDGELSCTLWGEHALNFEAKTNEVVFFKNASARMSSDGGKAVSVSRDSKLLRSLTDKRFKALQFWIQDQVNFQESIDTPQLTFDKAEKKIKEED